MRHLLFLFLFVPRIVDAQELFTYTEPASNMAAKSIGLRFNAMAGRGLEQRKMITLNPEIMFGISRKIMVHANAYWSNNQKVNATDNVSFNGAGFYVKYRFFSEDEVHSHFRLAAFAKAASSNILIEQPAINLNGSNTGYETGIVATKLINKVAISASAAYVKAYSNKGEKFHYGANASRAFEYTLSLGKLMLPKDYTDYNQTNVNLMLEMLGQFNPALDIGYVDLAPSVQMIFKSRMRLDLGYRFPVNNNLFRITPRGFLVRLEYNIFNAWK